MSGVKLVWEDAVDTVEFEEGWNARPDASNPYELDPRRAELWRLGHNDRRDHETAP